MPEVKVKHNVKDATPPLREVLPSGTYHALIIKIVPGVTRFKPELETISIEYQVVKTADGSVVNGEKDDKYHGRAVYQDYIIEMGTNDYNNQREAFRIQQLIAATGIPHTVHEGGQITFNTDHLTGKGVKITVTQRAGKKRPGDDPKAPAMLFNNVERIDSEQEIADENLV